MGVAYIDGDGYYHYTREDGEHVVLDNTGNQWTKAAWDGKGNPVQDMAASAEQTVRAMQAAAAGLPVESEEDVANAQGEFAQFLNDNGLEGELTRTLGMAGEPFIDPDGKTQTAEFSRAWWEVKIVTGRGALKQLVAEAKAWPRGVRGMGLADLLALRTHQRVANAPPSEKERQRTVAKLFGKGGKTRGAGRLTLP